MNPVQLNMPALQAGRQFKTNQKKKEKTSESLTSGYRINRAADDSAGLSISEKMRWQIRGLTRAASNAKEGISLIQAADGALGEIQAMLQRANELAVRAANGTMAENDRAALDCELQQLKGEIDATANKTLFNGKALFPEDGYYSNCRLAPGTYRYRLQFHTAGGGMSVSSTLLENNAARSAAGLGRTLNPVSAGGDIANIIAEEMIPKVLDQILTAFPAFTGSVAAGSMDVSIQVTGIDGRDGTLARAGWWTSGGTIVSMAIQVDSADFDLDDAQGNGQRTEALQSTIAHEFMHTVMQYSLNTAFRGLPEWFTEGTAQLAGGGFPTGWNNIFRTYAKLLTSAGDTTYDADIARWLGRYTIDNRPYGHGYLAAAYVGYLANGGGRVTGGNIAKGMNKIFADLLAGKSLDQALQDRAGLTQGQLRGLFSNGDPGLVDFVRRLSYASLGGAGSVITAALNVGGGSIIGGGGGRPLDLEDMLCGRCMLQVGALSKQGTEVPLYKVNTKTLGLSYTSLLEETTCQEAMDAVQSAIGRVSEIRGIYGALQNRLEHTIANLDNTSEQTATAESLIRDTDIPQAMVQDSIQQILLQAGISILVQANHNPQNVLSLLGT